MNCEYCGAALPENAAECPACGAKIAEKKAVQTPSSEIVCKQCGKVNSPDSRVCVNCRNHLQSLFICEKCGMRMQKAVRFCPRCGGAMIERIDGSFKKSRKEFTEASLLYGWTGIPLISIGWKKTGILTALWGFSSMVYWCVALGLSIWDGGWWDEFYVISCIAGAVWLFSIIAGFIIRRDSEGKELL